VGFLKQNHVAFATRLGREATPGPRISSLKTIGAVVFRTAPRIECTGDYAVVSLTGDIDLTVRSEILESYRHAIALMAVPHLLVDVSGVTFMDATGLGTLVAALKGARARGGTVSVVGASERILSLFHIGHLDGMIATPSSVYAGVEGAEPLA
jgi:anti-sigma B factor antagonist